MPLTFTQTFCVRHYECSADGRLHGTSYLRYMQEAAFGATTAAGYGMARYEELGRHWLARETEIEYLRPLHYGESVQVKTWVLDFRRVRSRRAYEFRLVGTDELVARAYTDWVFLESATGRPVSIPPDMMASFFPEGPPGPAPPRPRFPVAEPPPQGVLRQRRRAEWQHIDTAQHVNNAVYLAFIEDCAVRAAGARSQFQEEGLVTTTRRHRIEYLQPAVWGDELEIATWVSGIQDTTATSHYTVRRIEDGDLLVQAMAVWQVVRASDGQAIPISSTLLTHGTAIGKGSITLR